MFIFKCGVDEFLINQVREDVVDTCPIGQKCVRNFCLPNCNQDDQCSLGERCVENSCIKICFYDAHCLAGEFCEKSDQVMNYILSSSFLVKNNVICCIKRNAMLNDVLYAIL